MNEDLFHRCEDDCTKLSRWELYYGPSGLRVGCYECEWCEQLG